MEVDIKCVLCLLCCIGVANFALATDPISTQPNLIGYYGFDEPGLADGDITTDFGNTPWSDGLIHGVATTVSDPGGNGKGASTVLSYTRDAISGAICQELAKYNYGGSISVAAWVKLSSGDVYPAMVQKYQSFKLAAVRQSHFSFYGHGVTMRDLDGPSLTSSDTWHHLVGTYDSATGEAYLYVDGSEAESDLTGNTDFGTNTNLMKIGTNPDDGYNRVATCKIDDVAVYDVALDDADVLDIYQNGVKCGFAHKHSPANGQVVGSGTSMLSWKNAFGATACDVWWYGTDPANPSPTKVVDQLLVETASIPEALSLMGIYYWRVDTHVSSDLLTGRMVSMDVGHFAPVVDAGPDQQAYITDGTVDVQLDGTVTDDSMPAPYTVLWTTISGPGGVIYTPGNTVEDPAATMTVAGGYVLELEADDTDKQTADLVTIKVYSSSCAYTAAQDGFEWKPGDIDNDCNVDFDDLALAAAGWLACYHLECP